MQKYGYVYKTINKLNGRIYIGQKCGKFNPNYKGSGLLLRRALNKYGEENFTVEVLAYGLTPEERNRLEKRFIAEYRKIIGEREVYNIADGGQGGGMIGKKHSKATLKKMRINHSDFSGKNNPMAGKHRTEESKDKIRKILTGRKYSPERCENIRKALEKYYSTPEGIEKSRRAAKIGWLKRKQLNSLKKVIENQGISRTKERK